MKHLLWTCFRRRGENPSDTILVESKRNRSLKNEKFALDLINELADSIQNMLNERPTVRALLQRLLTKGRKRKLNFTGLNLSNIIIQAIQKKYEDWSRENITLNLGFVLAHAGDWGKKKKYVIAKKLY
ncbi:uncharacterized protein LOC113383152 [Ctenocephalides felis]|uniref:uncharacterized protein LOC113383152 n=1 Tax=Ctenocephalides felis TaxID=7515 RepID=UPI000E6E2674|nr:uncharacterized protein LOC113383152 [Ctenocephalides felis]